MEEAALERSKSASSLILHNTSQPIGRRSRLSLTPSPTYLQYPKVSSPTVARLKTSNWSINTSCSPSLLPVPGQQINVRPCCFCNSSLSCRSMDTNSPNSPRVNSSLGGRSVDFQYQQRYCASSPGGKSLDPRYLSSHFSNSSPGGKSLDPQYLSSQFFNSSPGGKSLDPHCSSSPFSDSSPGGKSLDYRCQSNFSRSPGRYSSESQPTSFPFDSGPAQDNESVNSSPLLTNKKRLEPRTRRRCASGGEDDLRRISCKEVLRQRSSSLYQSTTPVEKNYHFPYLTKAFFTIKTSFSSDARTKSKSSNELLACSGTDNHSSHLNYMDNSSINKSKKKLFFKSCSRDCDLSLMRGHLMLSSPSINQITWEKDKNVATKSYSVRNSLKKLRKLTRYYSRRSSKLLSFGSQYLDLDKGDSCNSKRPGKTYESGSTRVVSSVITNSFLGATCLLPPVSTDPDTHSIR